MSAHEIFLLVIIGLSILLDFRVKSSRKKRSAASSEKRARPSVPEFPTVSNLPLPAGEDEDLTWEDEDLTGEAEEPVGESGEPVPAAEEAGESLVAEGTEEALPQTYSPVVSGSFEVPDESAEDETPAVAAGGEKSPAIPEGDRREAIDPKKLVIYSEIMSPKFKEF